VAASVRVIRLQPIPIFQINLTATSIAFNQSATVIDTCDHTTAGMPDNAVWIEHVAVTPTEIGGPASKISTSQETRQIKQVLAPPGMGYAMWRAKVAL
jgi:hypothetical protein